MRSSIAHAFRAGDPSPVRPLLSVLVLVGVVPLWVKSNLTFRMPGMVVALENGLGFPVSVRVDEKFMFALIVLIAPLKCADVRRVEGYWPRLESLLGLKPKMHGSRVFLQTLDKSHSGQMGEVARQLVDRIHYIEEFLSTLKYRKRNRDAPDP